MITPLSATLVSVNVFVYLLLFVGVKALNITLDNGDIPASSPKYGMAYSTITALTVLHVCIEPEPSEI